MGGKAFGSKTITSSKHKKQYIKPELHRREQRKQGGTGPRGREQEEKGKGRKGAEQGREGVGGRGPGGKRRKEMVGMEV